MILVFLFRVDCLESLLSVHATVTEFHNLLAYKHMHLFLIVLEARDYMIMVSDDQCVVGLPCLFFVLVP